MISFERTYSIFTVDLANFSSTINGAMHASSARALTAAMVSHRQMG